MKALLDLLSSIFVPRSSDSSGTKKKKRKRPDEVVDASTTKRETVQRALRADPIGAHVQTEERTIAPVPLGIEPALLRPLLPVLTRPNLTIEPAVKSNETKYVVYEWSVPKPGHEAGENQDAFAKKETPDALLLNMGDGVSQESYDSGGYAQHLCTGFLQQRPKGAIDREWLTKRARDLAASWNERVTAQLAADPAELSWLDREQAPDGSKATLLGVELRRTRADGSARWKAFAVGDTNLFIVRDGKLIKAWPLEKSTDFKPTSPALCTGSVDQTEWNPEGKGSVKAGDHLLLMTDALAKYALRRHEAKDPIWNTLIGLKTPEAFARFVQLARKLGMVPDDTTMQHVIVPQYAEGLAQDSGGGS